MSRPSTTTKRISVTDARQHFSALLNDVSRGKSRVIIEKQGAPIAAIISPRDLEFFESMESRRVDQFKALDEVGKAFADVPLDQLEREVARAVAEVRGQTASQKRRRRSA